MGKTRVLRDPGRRLMPQGRYLSPDARQVDRARNERRPDRAWYGTARWQALRWDVLVRDDFTCARCGVESALAAECRALKAIGRADLVKGRAPDMVADHRIAHRGDAGLFWDVANLQTLCQRCHDRYKQREERSGGR
jgi:5-methylcytosine-specific restriction enzyme A